MSATDYLLEHATKNVWCSPEQDYQHIVRPKRISPRAGVRNKTEVLWSTIPLPTSTDWYHLYQIGEITPQILGLGAKKMQWITVETQCNTELLMLDLYTNQGIQIPRFCAYLLHTNDGNLLLAVKHLPEIALLGTDHLYMRFYSNAYFNRGIAQTAEDGLKIKGRFIVDEDTQYVFQREWRDHKVLKGFAFAFVNGRRVHDLNVTTLAIGDYAEFVWDSSIRHVVELALDECPNFLSNIDQKQKFLLHYPGISDNIEFRDDVDVYLIKRTNENIYDGVYYHKNAEDAMRMVTHKDYSIPVQYVMGYLAANPQWGPVDGLSVILHIRDSGLARPLVDEHHRIKELYKLPDADLLMAMVGSESNVPEWRAENLEMSKYPALMRHIGGQLSIADIQTAYGYNAISKLVADTPQVLGDGEEWVELPHGLWNNSTIYEYDANGVMLEYHNHGTGKFYPPRNPACKYVEGIVGKGGTRLNTIYNKTNVVLDNTLNYRFYVCEILDGKPTGNWMDVTGNSTYYQMVSGALLWKVDMDNYYTAIKSDDKFIAYDLLLSYRDGVHRFTINVDEVRTDGVVYPGKAEIPPGALDIWLNGHSLIRDLDYFVNWPEICLVNKEYLVAGLEQRITIRGTGFCNPDMSLPKADDYGFVSYGQLSKNNRFDIRDDKVMRIVIDGKLKLRDELVFAEDGSVAVSANVRNGSPYLIDDIVVPLRDLSTEDTYSMRAKSMAVDKRVSDYLTLKLPDPTPPNPDSIPRKYQIYSPYASKVMYDLQQGILQLDDFMGQYSDMDLREALTPYEWLLEYDPCYKPSIDLDQVSIHPHNLYTEITLNVYQYRFLMRTIRLKLNDRVDITKFVKIEPGFEHETADHPHPYRVTP